GDEKVLCRVSFYLSVLTEPVVKHRAGFRGSTSYPSVRRIYCHVANPHTFRRFSWCPCPQYFKDRGVRSSILQLCKKAAILNAVSVDAGFNCLLCIGITGGTDNGC